ncbi:MAG: dihydrolipoyl dehydrogenase [Defluviitaleaceae bacterium]|nr:dihydrolipoyl dehydrogenase [Defluviitaleaceae bacterium]MCL2275599.1 dihydrolipoyl dehydrogenase [Defluviitaleaceae bacterium]
MTHSNVIIIGGGPAGYNAAERAAQGGLTVTLFEERAMGGVCLNEGCIPTKAYLHSAKIYEYAKNGKAYGVTAENVKLDHTAVHTRKEKVVKTLVSGVEAKMKAHKINVVKTAATLNGKDGTNFIIEAEGTRYSGQYLLLAAGSTAIVPPINGLREAIEKGYAATSREMLEVKKVSKKLTVIGAGVVGLEMAAYFAAAGAQVIVIEMTNTIGGYTDNEIAEILRADLEKKGISFKLSCKVTGVEKGNVTYEKDGKTEKIATDLTLVAIGRAPRTQNMGLETLNIHTENGAIITDNQLRTNIPNVYAIGDINGKSMLAHTAYREGEVAVNHILRKKDVMRYDAIPAVIYTTPEVASVGESEESAHKKGIDFTVKKLSMRYSGRFVAENDKADGLCKLLVEKNTQRLIGVHLIGSYASEIIYGAAMMIESRWQIDDLKEIVFPHPTVSEIIRETLF